MSYKAITYDVKDESAVVTMNRPEARNALDITMREEIADVTLRIRDDESLKAMVLTGAGGAF
ncbi:MAG: enoyl-CoA hydratase/isomerase family protein, partial [Pseudomonadota bacterium]|nr:enoyl-CoA hydratase/isomerase family protein [Pseudomonadota bacterium]